MQPPNDDDVITLGHDDEDEEPEEELAPGPDERDMDLLDGSWEEQYYAGRKGSRDWSNVGLAVALIIVMAMVLPGILVMLR